MSTFYTRLAATATTLLNRFGGPIQIGYPARTVVGVRVKTVEHKFNADSSGFTGASGVQVGDIEYFMEATANPVKGEKFSATGESSMVVIEAEPLRPGDTTLAWTVWGRAA